MNDNLERARRIVEEFKCNNPGYNTCCCGFRFITGPTVPGIGPTGPTERLFKSSNRIIIDSS